MTRGVIIGKFYPPHAGHQFLIETGKAQVDELTVIVCHRQDQKIPGETRAAWLREMAGDVKVIVVPDVLPEDDSRGWATYTREVLGHRPDVVFTSEDYGDAYAGYLGARHVLVDKARATVSVSSTQIRAAPLECWDFLTPSVRAYFAVRVVLVGAESTGTTTLAQALAAHYRTVWVPEFGRLYWEAKRYAGTPMPWETSEFVFIAEEQNRLEDDLARQCDRILICDTDSFATTIWHERYLGSISPKVEQVASDRQPHLYLLTDAGIPFVQDGTREGEHIRLWMHSRFEEELEKRGKPFVVISGDVETRRAAALAAIDELVASNPTSLDQITEASSNRRVGS